MTFLYFNGENICEGDAGYLNLVGERNMMTITALNIFASFNLSDIFARLGSTQT